MKIAIIANWEELPLVLDLHTVALVFNVSDLTVKHWLYDGTLSGFKLGRKWCFDRAYIRSLVERKRR